MARVLLAGYLGSGNLGDDAIMLGLVGGLGDAPVDLAVLSGNPEETFRLYGMRSIPRRDMKAVNAAIGECDALVFPGGSIFQDVSSVASVHYYANLVKSAKSQGKKVVLVGQGVGPLNSFLGKRMAASAFNLADAVAVRDPSSMAALKALGVTKPIRVTADPAFLLPPPTGHEDVQAFGAGGMKSVGIAPRPFGKKGAREVVALFGEFCRLLYGAGVMPVLVEMDRANDGPLIEAISKSQGGKIPDIRKLQTPMQVQQRMARLDGIVAMRLHAGILAATVGVPPLMVNYDPKVTALARLLDVGSPVAMQGLTPTRLLDAYLAFAKDRERNGKIVARKREEMTRLAQGNVDLVLDTLGIKREPSLLPKA